MQQASRKAEPVDYKHAVNDINRNVVANVGVNCVFIEVHLSSRVGTMFDKLINRPIEA